MSDDAVPSIATTPITESISTALVEIIEKVTNHEYGREFAQPVNHKELGLVDYLEVIQRPMDLGTLRKNLRESVYKFFFEFVQDMDLIFTNSMKYNGPDNPYYVIAQSCQAFAQEQLTQIEAIPMTLKQEALIIAGDFDHSLEKIRPLTATEIQLIAHKMSKMNEQQKARCVYYYLSRKGVSDDDMTAGASHTVDFDVESTEDVGVLRDFLHKVLEVAREG
ncbi:Bromodomain-containing protein [Carpediemonas membranifera]|uniref:Bromodomain-containing protein n=1 Tax=Carpediemonas membranifera TaxID=201153 RepID=A0A8J6E423_9EUKA|nr:Bromodomain-containing protein [Carpediemonas membranifera]|eukprot:KAG9393922.1 Bromodomain-containing protein [Carpediemonas membranifera]